MKRIRCHEVWEEHALGFGCVARSVLLDTSVVIGLNTYAFARGALNDKNLYIQKFPFLLPEPF